MAHGTRVNNTAYGVTGGKCLVGGTAYSIKKGRTLIGGTGYDIAFTPSITLHLKIVSKLRNASSEYVEVEIDRGRQDIEVTDFEVGSVHTYTYEYKNNIQVRYFGARRGGGYAVISDWLPCKQFREATVLVDMDDTSVVEGYEE